MYNAMETTKRRHFDYLGHLESRHTKFNLEPSQLENEILARLLRDHDEQVKAFKTASQKLRQSDPKAFDALWNYINDINNALKPSQDREAN